MELNALAISEDVEDKVNIRIIDNMFIIDVDLNNFLGTDTAEMEAALPELILLLAD